MDLDTEQRNQVARWVEEGLELSEIQRRLVSELGLNMTYMEVRFLLGDLHLELKDREEEAPPEEVAPAAPENPDNSSLGGVRVTVDQVTRPGALVSGRASFSDGKDVGWQLDQMGRLSLSAEDPGYRPPPEDLEDFQLKLRKELASLGY